MTHDEIRKILGTVRNRKVLVVGDVMVDEYVWGRIERISPEAPIQVVDVQSENALLGGAANVAGNLIALSSRVLLAGAVGSDDKGALLKTRLREEGVRIQGLVTDPKRPTSVKTRVMGQHQQLLRIDREQRIPLSGRAEARLINYVRKQIPLCDGVILSDYGKGVLTDGVLAETLAEARRCRKIVVADPKRKDLRHYRGVTCLTPNRKEASEALGLPLENPEQIHRAARELQRLLKSPACLITLGKDGMALLDRDAFILIPTVAREVFDVSGAGDTVIAVFTLVAAAGHDFTTAAHVANTAAGIVVGKVGAARVSPQEVMAYHGELLSPGDGKILEAAELRDRVRLLQGDGKRVVFTNGCFDLLHVGHIQYLQAARRLGDCLIVGLNSDASVRRLKGKRRPLISEEERSHILAALDCVDYLTVFNESTPMKLIRTLRPNILVKGRDYRKQEVVGADFVESYGGQVALVPVVQGKSTSEIVQRIVQRYGEPREKRDTTRLRKGESS